MLPSVLRGVSLRDLETIKTIARKAYPSVPQLSTNTLAERMEEPGSLLLVDVRSPSEFAFSHLRGAINLQTADRIAEAIREQQPSQTVLYCSVGFRSSRLAHTLAKRGVSGVMNLEGSIFQWANEERAVFRDEQEVGKVHPFGKRWAGLLKTGVAAECQ